jgi:uncharacterized protein YecT (DUF1311 family)
VDHLTFEGKHMIGRATLLALFVVSNYSPVASAKDCNDESGAENMYDCFAEQLASSDRQIRKLLRQLRSSVPSEYKPLLERSQQTWLAYRNADCELQFSADDPRRKIPCRLQHNEARIVVLRETLTENCNGCIPKQ